MKLPAPDYDDLPAAMMDAAMDANCSDAWALLAGAQWIHSIETLVRDFLSAEHLIRNSRTFRPELLDEQARLDALRDALSFAVRWHPTGTKPAL